MMVEDPGLEKQEQIEFQGTEGHYGLDFRIGERSIGPLIQLIIEYLPADSRLEVTTPFGKVTSEYVQAVGTKSQNNNGVEYFSFHASGPGSPADELVRFLLRDDAKTLGIWITASSREGICIVEMEAGNNYIWLHECLGPRAHQKLLTDIRRVCHAP